MACLVRRAGAARDHGPPGGALPARDAAAALLAAHADRADRGVGLRRGGRARRLRTVFASRHGSVNESIEMIEQIARRERLSPATFSHTVHNAQAGLYCIAAQNRSASCSLAGRTDTFACGWLEVLAHLDAIPPATCST